MSKYLYDYNDRDIILQGIYFLQWLYSPKLNLVEVSAEQSISNKGEQTFSAAIAQGFPAR